MTHPVDTVLKRIEQLREQRLWGAKTLAEIAGVTPRTIQNWSRRPDCPISKAGGRYFCTRTAFVDWLTTHKADAA